jgi:hypothetical protein
MKTYEITVWLEVQIFFFFKLIIPEIQHLIVGENRRRTYARDVRPSKRFFRAIMFEASTN